MMPLAVMDDRWRAKGERTVASNSLCFVTRSLQSNRLVEVQVDVAEIAGAIPSAELQRELSPPPRED
jgi:hypothetical protein